MNILERLPGILADAEKEYRSPAFGSYPVYERYGSGSSGNIVACGRAEDFTAFLLNEKKMMSAVDMVYIDPPFFTGTKRKASFISSESGEHVQVAAFEDVWEGGEDGYLRSLAVSLYGIRDLLSESGLVWVHIDWRMSHYIRVLMDEIFGRDNFVNEIIWQYRSGGSTKRHFARKHDTILVYAKTGEYFFQPLSEKSYNRGLKPYRFRGVSEYRDEIGWYTVVNMRDVWSIDMVGRTSSERTGYAAQKPESLLERAIASSTREGDLCADFYGGSGTLAAVAARMGRKFITSDAGVLAVKTSIVRLTEKDAAFDVLGNPQPSPEPEGIRIADDIVDVSAYIAGRNIDLWSIDPDYDGMVHNGRIVIRRDSGGIESCCDMRGMQTSMFGGDIEWGRRISLVFYDMRGSRAQKIINLQHKRS